VGSSGDLDAVTKRRMGVKLSLSLEGENIQ
jgi:hypothetical protein